MRRPVAFSIAVVLAAVAGLAVWTARGATAEEPAKTEAKAKPDKKGEAKALHKFMREKLEASNLVLEGLTTENFELIEKGAATMQRISSAEQWQISNDAMYRQHSAQFRRVVEQLQKKAKEKQLEGAALAWIEGTMSCIECHKWVRSTLVAGK